MRVLIVALLLVYASATPVLIWGNALSQHGAESFEHVQAGDMLDVFTGSENKGLLKKFVVDKPVEPELIVFYVCDEKDFATVADVYAPQSPLSSVFTSSASLALPYARISSPLTQIISPVWQRISTAHPTSSRRLDIASTFSDSRVHQDAMLAMNREHIKGVVVIATNNGNEIAQWNQFFVSNSITTTSALVVTEKKQEHVGRSSFSMRAAAGAPNVTDSCAARDPRPQSYFPSYVWGWLLVLLILIAFYTMGISAIASLQVPPRLLSPQEAAHRKNK